MLGKAFPLCHILSKNTKRQFNHNKNIRQNQNGDGMFHRILCQFLIMIKIMKKKSVENSMAAPRTEKARDPAIPLPGT